MRLKDCIECGRAKRQRFHVLNVAPGNGFFVRFVGSEKDWITVHTHWSADHGCRVVGPVSGCPHCAKGHPGDMRTFCPVVYQACHSSLLESEPRIGDEWKRAVLCVLESISDYLNEDSLWSTVWHVKRRGPKKNAPLILRATSAPVVGAFTPFPIESTVESVFRLRPSAADMDGAA